MDPEVDAGCGSHLEIWALFPWAYISGILLLLLQGFERLLRAVVTCCLASIIYLSATLACSSRLPMTMIQYASGVRGLQNQGQIRGLQVQTLRHLPTSEITS